MIVGSVLPRNSVHVYAIEENSIDNSTIDRVDYLSTNYANLSKINVIGELKEQRTSSSKTFVKEDGTYEVAIYNDVVHYYQDNEWKQIDNSLNDLGDELETSKNSFKLKFPKNLDDNKQIRLTQEKYSIYWKILDIESSTIYYDGEVKSPSNIKELTNINQTVTYYNIVDNVDVEYTVTGSKIKEKIIINEYVNNFSMNFEYKLKDLSLVEDEEGNFYFINDKNEAVFSLSELYMFDSEMNTSFDVKYHVVETENKTYEISIIPDDNWLKSASYPVIIDPTISGVLSGNIEDTYVYQGAPTTNYSTLDYMIVSNIDDVLWYKGLIKFTIPTFLYDMSVTYSNLKLTERTVTDGRSLVLYQNTSTWSLFRATWNRSPSYSTSIVDYHIIDNSDVPEDSQYVFNITDSVKGWLNGTPNYGFTIMDKGIFNAYNSLWTTRYTDSSCTPIVEIGYIDNTGIKDYWTYQSQNVSEAGTGYISDYTGLLTFLRNDFEYSTERDTLSLSMVYNINNVGTDYGYGLGWQSNYNMSIEYDASLSTYFAQDSTGSIVYYHKIDDNITLSNEVYPDYMIQLFSLGDYADIYIAEDGSGKILMALFDDSDAIQGIYILSTDFTLYYFEFESNDIYYLNKIKMNSAQVNHSSITIGRNFYIPELVQSITTNTDAVNYCGNSIQLTYDQGRLASAILYLYIDDSPTYKAIEKTEYEYTDISGVGDYALTSVIKKSDLDGDSSWTTSSTIAYTYDNAGKLLTAELPNQNKVVYTYGLTTKKIDTVSYYDNDYIFETLNYEYENKKTTITDQDTKYIENKFDDYGHTINIIDSDGIIQSFSYMNIFTDFDEDTTGVTTLIDGSPNYNNNNKLISQSDPQSSNQIQIFNSGFEYDLNNSYDNWSNIINELGENAILSRNSSSPYAEIETYCAKITTSSGDGAYITQNLTLEAGTYTVSGYIYNSTSSLDSVYIDVLGTNYGTSLTYANLFNEWSYVNQYFVIESPTTISIKLAVSGLGYGCFDAIQITKGFGVGSINLMENSSFEYAYSSVSIPEWYGLTTGVSRVVSTFDNVLLYQDILDDYSIRIDGSGTSLRSISNKNTSFLSYDESEGVITIGGWAKSEGTPTTSQTNDIYNRAFRIKVVMYDSLDNALDTKFIDFDSSVEGWQFGQQEIDLVENIAYIVTSLEYQGEGSVFFDNIQMKYEAVYKYYTYDSAGRIKIIRKANNAITEYTYATDSANTNYTRIPSSMTKDGIFIEISSDAEEIEDMTINNVKVTYSNNDYGQNIGITFGEESIDYYSTSTSYLATSYYQYKSSDTDEFGNTTNYYYDIYNGLLKAIENAKYQDIKYNYDDKGNLIEVIATPDYTEEQLPIIDGKVAYLYDSFNRLYKICIDYYSPGTPTFYYEITYDPQNRIEHIKVNTTNLMTYTYVDNSYYSENISTETYANMDSIQYVYDQFDQVTDVQFKLSGESVYTTRYRYAYDENGFVNVYTEVDSLNNVIDREFYIYDSSGRISQIQDKDGNIIQYQYDSLGNVASLKFIIDDVENETIFEFDSESKISETSYETLAYNIIQKQYDYTDLTALERLHNVSLFVGSTEMYNKSFIYDNDTTRVTNIEYNISGTYSEDFGFSYLYDELGNIVEAAYYLNSSLVELVNYEYDSLNQLIVEDIYYTDSMIRDLTYVYVYDQHGNRIQKSEYDYERNGLDSAKNILYYNYDSVWDDQLDYYDIHVNGNDYSQSILSYDAQGNPLEITNFVYINLEELEEDLDNEDDEKVYDHAELVWEARTLISITIYDEYNTVHAVINYTYNADGYRTSKTITEGLNYKQYTYGLLGSNVIHEEIYSVINLVQTTRDIYYTYDFDGTLVGFNLNSEDYFYINNIQGDIVAIVDQDGNAVVKYDYDSYGNIIQKRIDSGFENVYKANSYTYRGYRYDIETGLYYLQSRYYNPEIGRFISSDGLLGQQGDILSTNMYAYCSNNPVINIDPTGYWVLSLIGITVYLGINYLSVWWVFDGKGNQGLLITAGAGVTYPNASLTYSPFFSWRKTIFDLEGLSSSRGVSVSYMGASVGVDFLKDANGYLGFQLNIGGSTAVFNAQYSICGTTLISFSKAPNRTQIFKIFNALKNAFSKYL
jgi:RHS repeat-associated protein